MPKRLAEKDKTNIYCAYKLGEIDNITKFANPVMLRGQFVSLKGSKRSQYYGIDMKYDGIIIFEENADTRYIDEFSKFWVDYEPLNGNVSAQYKSDGILSPKDGLKTLYVYETIENAHNLWCMYEDGNIYKIDVKLEESEDSTYKYRAIVPLSMYLQITNTTKVWYEEPDNENDTTSLLQLVKVESNNFNSIYYFKEV